MRIAVTGGTGYLGAHTVRALLKAGHQTKLLVAPDDPATVIEPLRELGELTVLTGDVRAESTIEELLAGADAVLHAAGIVGTDERRAQPMWDVNAYATEAILDPRGRARARSGRVGQQLQRAVPAAERHHLARLADGVRPQRVRQDQGLRRPRRPAAAETRARPSS